jgi:hypothetical protein
VFRGGRSETQTKSGGFVRNSSNREWAACLTILECLIWFFAQWPSPSGYVDECEHNRISKRISRKHTIINMQQIKAESSDIYYSVSKQIFVDYVRKKRRQVVFWTLNCLENVQNIYCKTFNRNLLRQRIIVDADAGEPIPLGTCQPAYNSQRALMMERLFDKKCESFFKTFG